MALNSKFATEMYPVVRDLGSSKHRREFEEWLVFVFQR